MIASLFPEQLTALRAFGLVLAVLLFAFAVWRRGSLSNGAVLLAIFGALALAIVSGTELLDGLLSAFAFKQGNGGRILGLAVFAIAILFLLVLRALTESARMNQQLSSLLEGLAWEEFREARLPERFRDKIAVVIPAYNEAESVGDVVREIPPRSAASRTAVLVVDDGSRDDTSEEAAKAGAVVARHVINRGGGAALRTGYRLMAESGAQVVVTLDADGQHLPSEMERLVKPVLDDEVDVAHGSRVLGEADPNSRSRELGIVFFNRVVSLHHAHPGLGLLQRLPRRPHLGSASAGAAPGAVPHLRVPDRGDQARRARQGGAGDRGRSACTAIEEAGRRPLRPRLRQRGRADLAQVMGRSAGPGRTSEGSGR